MHCWGPADDGSRSGPVRIPSHMGKNSSYTCQDYRQEMILLGLQRRLSDPDLSDEERRTVIDEIQRLEQEMHFC